MNLSDHFTLEEMTRTSYWEYQDEPSSEALQNLRRLCVSFLEPARDVLGSPLQITSGYRSAMVNRKVGGVTTSAHRFGRAADFIPQGISVGSAFDILRHTDLPFDQLIFERKGDQAWIHLGILEDGKEPRRQILRAVVDPETSKAHYEKVI